MSRARKHKKTGISDDWSAARACLGPDGRLSVVMPAYNLGPSISANSDRVRMLLDGRIPFEIVVVDDGSRDNTADELRAAAERNPDIVRPVLLAANAGKGAALRAGLAACSGTHVLLLDGDLDLSPERIPTFFTVMQAERADIVIGSKRHPQSQIDYPWHRRLASRVYYTLVRILVGLPVTDTQTGMKLFCRAAIAWAFERMLCKSFAFDLEMLAICHAKGYRVAEAPIRMEFGNKVGCLSLSTVKHVMVDTLAIFYRLRILRYYPSVEVHPLPDPLPLVSIIIACPAPSPYLDECLAGIARQTYARIETLVLPDLSAQLNAAPAAGLRVIPTGHIRPSEKRNRGIREARGTLVAFLDDDTIPDPDWLAHAVPYFSDSAIAAAGGPGVTPANDPWMAQLGGAVYANRLVSGACVYRYRPGRVRSVDDLPSCNLLVRADVLRDLGGFNTAYWPGEDTILCSEIVHRLGRRIVYDPWASVAHHRRALFGPHLRQVGRYALHRGFFAKRFPTTSRRPAYMLPSLFVLGLVLGAPLAGVHPWLERAYLCGIATYLLLTGLASIRKRPLDWLLVWLGIIATHLVYGVRFLQGLFSSRMPCERQRFDHPSENRTSDAERSKPVTPS
jgi:glycosyltransferase involved in cell wall biosynthesis